MPYLILEFDQPHTLTKHVRSWMERGWLPCGGVCVRHNPLTKSDLYTQAIMCPAKEESDGSTGLNIKEML